MRSESNSKKKIDIDFFEIIKILNDNNIKYWVCHGTLLGIIRDNNLIPWDHDIDIALWSKNISKEKITEIMLSNNFKLLKKYYEDASLTFKKNEGKRIDINFYKISKEKNNNKPIAYADFCIPKNFFFRLLDALSMSKKYEGKFKYFIKSFSIFERFFEKLKIYLIKKKLFYGYALITQPLELLSEFKEFNYKGVILTVPKKTEEYLVYMYGKDWKIPIANYNTIKDNNSTIYHL